MACRLCFFGFRRQGSGVSLEGFGQFSLLVFKTSLQIETPA